MIRKLSLTRLIPVTLIYKLLALGSAYGIWSIIAKQQLVALVLTVPVTYTQVPAPYTAHGPATLQLHLSGPRRALQQLAAQPLALSLDRLATNLNQQLTNAPAAPSATIELNQQTLALPDNVRLLHQTPAIIKVQLSAHSPAPKATEPSHG